MANEIFSNCNPFWNEKKDFEIYNNYFSSKGIKFDAIYKRNRTYNLYLQDYSQIFFDFNKLDSSNLIKKVAVNLIIGSHHILHF